MILQSIKKKGAEEKEVNLDAATDGEKDNSA
jgi:hypothetical protein